MLKVRPVDAQPRAIFDNTFTYVSASAPIPPYSLGTESESNPVSFKSS